MKSFVVNVIDCDDIPASSFFSCKVSENRKGGKVVWDRFRYSERRYLVASERLKTTKSFSFEDFRREVGGMEVMNACILDWLMQNPSQVPPFWDNKTVIFFGTIYESERGHRFVRSLSASKGKCSEKYLSLEDVMKVQHYAAVFR